MKLKILPVIYYIYAHHTSYLRINRYGNYLFFSIIPKSLSTKNIINFNKL